MLRPVEQRAACSGSLRARIAPTKQRDRQETAETNSASRQRTASSPLARGRGLLHGIPLDRIDGWLTVATASDAHQIPDRLLGNCAAPQSRSTGRNDMEHVLVVPCSTTCGLALPVTLAG